MKLIPRKEWENLTYFAGGSHGMGEANPIGKSVIHGMDGRSEINPGKSGLPKFFTIFAEINKYNKYENKIEYTD
jgi:hypothetical protein